MLLHHFKNYLHYGRLPHVGGRTSYYLSCSYAEMPGCHLDCTDSETFIECLLYTRSCFRYWEIAANRANKILALWNSNSHYGEQMMGIKYAVCQMVISTRKKLNVKRE